MTTDTPNAVRSPARTPDQTAAIARMAATMAHEVRNRWTGAVLFSAAVDASLATGHRIGLTVRLAIEAGADLAGADLRGADLRGADLTGAVLTGADLRGAVLTGADLMRAVLMGAKIIKVVARATRSDGYDAIAFSTDKGIVIRAGCQTWFGTDAGRAHVATYAERGDRTPEIAAETMAILDFIDARAKQEGV